ncbi:conserved hypothetical protein [Methylobacterium sp. 4-46]|uniref:hypothetical protein n=1 Tax=unclassified Methylobacterium TaxID=2615210 RepID=UPI000152D4BB|nr:MULTISPECIES: hypothetical protein [Methylobacterium]ACA20942.1 conserved hypothetical protein [Methylobacterium sp. 4-46]WFT80097.1 hypothetical protein QA634_33795 [Methylobacterium nodulans]
MQEASTTGSGNGHDSERAALLALHAEREGLERRLALARQQRLYLSDPEAIAAAEAEERDLLVDLDRLLTRIRAAEYRRRPGGRPW